MAEISRSHMQQLIVAYTEYFALRTLGSAEDSAFRVEHLPGAVALIDPARSCPSLCNRVLCWEPGCEDALARVPSLYEHRSPCLELASCAWSQPMLEVMQAAGYMHTETLYYLARKPASHASPYTRIERWGPDRADEFAELLDRSTGYKVPLELWEKRRAYYCTDRFRTFVAMLDGEPAAWATLFVDGHAGVFANAYTFEEFRGRGSHSALLERRLHDAFELELDWVLTDVEYGTPSYRNCRKRGFSLCDVHTVWQVEG